MRLINFALLKNPINYFVVGVVLLFVMYVMHELHELQPGCGCSEQAA